MTTTEIIIALISATGLGGILGGIFGAYFQSRFQRQKELSGDLHRLKRDRYGAISIQMLTIIDPDNLTKASIHRPDLKGIEDYINEVRTESLNGVIFASDDVLKALVGFIQNPSLKMYIKTIVAMRKDLWGNKTSIDEVTLLPLYDGKFKK